jgi:hypothetical protein
MNKKLIAQTQNVATSLNDKQENINQQITLATIGNSLIELIL